MSICCRAVAFLHGRIGWSRVLGLSCSPVSCRTYGKHSLPVRNSTGPGRGRSEPDSVRTPAGAPPPTSWKPALCSGSQCALYPFVSRHKNQLLRPFHTMCRMGEAPGSCEKSCCWGDGRSKAHSTRRVHGVLRHVLANGSASSQSRSNRFDHLRPYS